MQHSHIKREQETRSACGGSGTAACSFTKLAPADSAVYASLRDAAKDVLDTLTRREAKVLRMRFGIEMNTDPTRRSDPGRGFTMAWCLSG